MSIRHPLELLISMIYQNETWADPAVTSTIDSDIETAFRKTVHEFFKT